MARIRKAYDGKYVVDKFNSWNRINGSAKVSTIKSAKLIENAAKQADKAVDKLGKLLRKYTK